MFPRMLLLVGGVFACGVVAAADWPMWRRDAARSAESPEKLPDNLQLRWTRELPRLAPAYREPRLQFDAGYEPVVLGKTMFVASSRSDSLLALDTETGTQRWVFYAEGPIRCAPAAWHDQVFFGSDDGHLYCLGASQGELRWKFRAVPSGRKVLGNGRMISLWPLRGGPVVHDGRVYFAAGVWSFEGVFVYCLDAATGQVVWRSDECSFVYGTQPHAAEALGGVTPQGYLAVAGDELIVPCGQALPARLDLASGKLLSFELPRAGRQPGGWFASAALRRGEITLDAEINRDLHEDRVYQGPGSPGVRSTISIAGEPYRFGDGFPGVKGEIHSMLAADEKLFVVDLEGRLYCFGVPAERVRRYGPPTGGSAGGDSGDTSAEALQLLELSGLRHGYAWIQSRGARQPSQLRALIDTLLRESKLHLVVTDPDPRRLDELRRRYRAERDRICLLADAAGLELPPYFASLVVAETRAIPDEDQLDVLRPYGGTACLPLSAEDHARLVQRYGAAGEFAVQRSGDLTLVRRTELAGAVNYTGGWTSPDERVRAPLGVLWFDDALGHFKRSPQPWFVDGLMVSYPKDWMEKHRANRSPPYDLLPPQFSDVYTGRIVDPQESIVASLDYPRRDLAQPQPNQYRPPTQLDAWKPKQPVVGQRINPLTVESEPRAIPKSYGCDGGVDYGFMYTMRSGTPAFYDKRLESGVCSIAGPRSGCTNSIIPACGVLNVPYFYEGCTCSYPLPVGLAMISRPATHEQWFSWGPGKAENIQRLGVNFGAPGDRMSPAGTLWLDYPSRGGPSPEVSITVQPASADYFYQHSLFVAGGVGWPWVAASGVQGAEAIEIAGLKPGRYTVRLYFAEPQHAEAAQRVFSVSLDDRLVWSGVDVVALAGGRLRAVVRESTDVEIYGKLRLNLQASRGRTILSGLELVATGLGLDELPGR